MAGNIGYFMGGIAKGLTAGANLGMQITQIRWQKKKQKELDDLTVKMNDSWNSIGQELISLANDGQLSEDDKLKIYTLTIAAPYEMQGVMQNLRSSLAQFDSKGFDSQMELIKTFYDYAQGMDVTDIDTLYETFRGYITDPHASALFEVADKKLRHEYEAGQIKEKLDISAKLPTEYKYPYLKEEGLIGEITPTTKAPTMADEKSAITLLKTFVRATPEQFEAQRTRIEQRTGLDLSVYTQDILRETGSEMYNLYNTPEEVMANVKAPAGLNVIPKRDTTTGKYYASFSKETGVTPEGEISAGEKRTFDMASSIMFGSSDWVTGISKPGIISQNISNKLNMGQPLTEEEKTEVRNNYNAIKDTLPGEVISVVESQLQRYGIPLEVTPPMPITPEPEPETGIIQKGVEGVKSWLGMKGVPKTGEIPTPKVSPGAKEAMIPTMTKQELYDALSNTDRSDPLWDLLYAEAIKRGYITE